MRHSKHSDKEAEQKAHHNSKALDHVGLSFAVLVLITSFALDCTRVAFALGNSSSDSSFRSVFVAFASFALDCTRAVFALGNSSCETLSFLAKHSWVFRVACWVGVARCLAGVPWFGWLLLLLAVLVWLGWLSSLFSLPRLGVSPATLDLSSLCFLNLPKGGGNYRQLFSNGCCCCGLPGSACMSLISVDQPRSSIC